MEVARVAPESSLVQFPSSMLRLLFSLHAAAALGLPTFLTPSSCLGPRAVPCPSGRAPFCFHGSANPLHPVSAPFSSHPAQPQSEEAGGGATTPSRAPYAGLRDPQTNLRLYYCSTSRGRPCVKLVSRPSLTERVVPKHSQDTEVNRHPRRRLFLIGSEEPRPTHHFRRKRTREIRLEGACFAAEICWPAILSVARAGSPASASGEELWEAVLGEGKGQRLLTKSLTAL